jgi:hypothetical protein
MDEWLLGVLLGDKLMGMDEAVVFRKGYHGLSALDS